MIWILFFIFMGYLGRLSGNGFGSKWGLGWLPELLHSLPYGLALGWAVDYATGSFWASHGLTAAGTAISYAGMQSATWMFLRWRSHDDPNIERNSTLKPIVDYIAGLFGYRLGDEGYAWVACSIKGFITTLPVGGVMGAILFPLGDEIGSHFKGRVERFGIDHFIFREFFRSALGSISILAFVQVFLLFV
jgi:hypothetical protein